MAISKELVSVLACPKCHGPVRLTVNETGLLCSRCQLEYPVRDDVPVMMVEEGLAAGQLAADEMSQAASEESVTIEVVDGKSKGMEFTLSRGSCRAMGRSIDDMESTRVFDAGAVVALDDSTKQMVLSYITQQFQAAPPASETGGKGDLGSFQRLPDVALSDGAISRLHAMMFYGPTGVGVLDLVSKNGTFVNGVEVESRLLKPGDVVSFGSTKLRLGQSGK